MRTAITSLIGGSPFVSPISILRWTFPPQFNGDVYGVVRPWFPVVPLALVALFGVKFLAFTNSFTVLSRVARSRSLLIRTRLRPRVINAPVTGRGR